MLILTRRKGEYIEIESGIRVTVLEIAGKRVRLGIEAPEGVHIRRGELEPLDEAKEEGDSRE